MIKNVTEWLDKTEEHFPEKIAVCDELEQLTFRILRKKALAIARVIIQEFSEVNKPIVVYLEKSAKVIVSFMGIAYSGNFYSPIDIGMPEVRVSKILQVLQSEIVITTKELKNEFEKYDFHGKYILYEEIMEHEDDENIVRLVQNQTIDTDLLYVLFTSGSTGTPKGVSITHRSVIDYIDWVTDTFGITENDSFGNQAPFYFDNSILDIYCTVKTGATLYIIPRLLFVQPVLLLRFLKENAINTIFWVPSALMVVSKLNAFKNVDISETLRRVLFCGEVMPNKQLNIWRRNLPNAIYANLYGPTEITDACTYYIVDREFDDDEILPIGLPMRNTQIIVLDENDNLVSRENIIGELCVKGTCLSVGYYNNLEKTKEAFVQNPLNHVYEEKIYRTGDLVRYNEYGELVYITRKDFQIKHMGHRIELGEIEAAVSSLEGITLCCCLYDTAKQKIVLFIDREMTKKDIHEQLKHLLPEYMMPSKVSVIKDMPLNANGKIDRGKLKELLA